MTTGRDHKVLWLGTLIGSLTLGVLPIFTKASVFTPVEIGAGVLLMIVSLLGLRRPRRIRLPRKRHFLEAFVGALVNLAVAEA